MFACTSGIQHVPYSMVCDHRRQCDDDSDESFCVFPSCSGSTPLQCDASSQCPDNGYCLPVFVRCNGIIDCPGTEDEAGCSDSVQCPGFYRCRSSTICLHPSHVCDGVHQCPQHDDEVFCHLLCPAGCTCHGLAFTCNKPFLTERHPDVRYLDASGSSLTPAQLAQNTLLVHLSLSRCGLKSLFNSSFPNLHSLDLSQNGLQRITAEHLLGMPNLQRLSLCRNPIKTLFLPLTDQLSFPALRMLDVSGVKMHTLSADNLAVFSGLHVLNLSRCGVVRVDGGLPVPKLRVLDTLGCPMTQFPPYLLRDVDQLQIVRADNFKLCCSAVLPAGFKMANCQAPFDEISSCESLLRSFAYRIILSLFSCFALLGNLGCFLLINVFSKSSASGFGVFVTHLSISDFLMGVYLAVIGVTDRLYKGSYLWKDISWRHSAACRTAGFLSLLAHEVSAFIVCLITLDRFLVLCFPFSSSLQFKTRSAHITCAAVWIVAMVMAVVPLTPMTSHWSFFSQTGICIPLPVTRKSFAGRDYAFGVLIVCNFFLFLFIAAGQAAIYISIQANRMSTADTTKKSMDLRIARRLISVAVSDFLCWFPIGLVGLLASRGVPIPGEVNVGMAVLVLPLNSALNPFLYTINVLLERRKKSREEQLLKQLMAQMLDEEP